MSECKNVCIPSEEEIKFKNNPERVYYQSKSEIDDVTARYLSFQVYHSKEACEKAFPDSQAIAMNYQTVESPDFLDLNQIPLNNKLLAETFDRMCPEYSYISWEDVNDDMTPCFGSEFSFVIFKNKEIFPSLGEYISKVNWMDGNALEEEGLLDEIQTFYKKVLEHLNKGEGVVIGFLD